MAPTLREETTAPQSYSINEAERRFIEVAERLCREESREAEKARDEAEAAKAKARTKAKGKAKATGGEKPAGVTKPTPKSGCKLLYLSSSHLLP